YRFLYSLVGEDTYVETKLRRNGVLFKTIHNQITLYHLLR
ncbi:MAG: hypothetical protein ACI86M_001879, partial [Saprospiraceae bacterium]